MSKKHKEYLINVGNGSVLPYKTIAIMRRLRVSLEDAQQEFGASDLNKMLLAFMEPECGR